MFRLSPGIRALWLAAIALQVFLPAAAALADARIERAEAAKVSHVESHTTKACARVHPPDCGLCRFLSATFRAAALIRPEPEAANHASPIPVAPQMSRRGPHGTHPHSRAPPVLS